MKNQVVGWVKRSETQPTNLCLFALWGETYMLMLGFMLQPNLQIFVYLRFGVKHIKIIKSYQTVIVTKRVKK